MTLPKDVLDRCLLWLNTAEMEGTAEAKQEAVEMICAEIEPVVRKDELKNFCNKLVKVINSRTPSL